MENNSSSNINSEFNPNFTFKIPKSSEKTNSEDKIQISADEIIPKGSYFNDFENLLEAEIKQKNSPKFKTNPEIKKNNTPQIINAPPQTTPSKKINLPEYGKKSHLEYIKIINQNKDPLGVISKGGLRLINMEEVKQHNTSESCWTVLNGNVYDITMYVDYHPGGAKKLLLGAGKDCTSLFNKYHSWVNINMLIGKLQIGRLVKTINDKEANRDIEIENDDDDESKII